jgi:hypothetical protein
MVVFGHRPLFSQLEKLSKLHDDGKLTDEEFMKLKKKIIW